VKRSSVDYIVVGQGLAGSCVAIQLLMRGRQFVVIDQPDENKCSVVAAGLFNPVTGQNLVKTWQADILFPYLDSFYQKVEQQTVEKFFYPTPLYRPFASVEEQNEWMGRSTDAAYKAVIETIHTIPTMDGIRDPHGGLVLKQCGYIDTPAFLKAVRQRLEEDQLYWRHQFDPQKLSVEGTHVTYEHITATRIIFCEGTRVLANPWFNKLPVRALKGETIRIRSDYKKHVIINRGVYMVPGNDDGEWRVGATYNLRDRSDGNTREGMLELEEKLAELIEFDYQVVDAEWGLRPTVIDRRPIIGKHPKFDQLIIFNGLGTKGVSLAPYFSEVLVQGLETSNPLNNEVDVSRFKSLY